MTRQPPLDMQLAGPHPQANAASPGKPVVVVTGASEGIGLAIARRFLEKGSSVMLVARGEGRVMAGVQMLGPLVQSGRVLVPLPLDVMHTDAYAQMRAEAGRHGLYIDVLVNNAGMGLGGRFEDQSEADLERLVALNVAALTRLTHAAIADMRGRGRGHIINIASLGGYVPGPYQAAYYASKAYVLSLSEAVAEELNGSGVKVSVVAPGPVNTGFHASMGAEKSFYRYLLLASSPAQVAASVYRGHRLGLRVIVPGILNRLMLVALRVLPHPLTVWLAGWLLKPRR